MHAMTTVVLSTVHGSHLYGTAHAASDLDTYTVLMNSPVNRATTSVKTKQLLVGNDDVLTTGLTEFLVKCEAGVPQALEAMFSPVAHGLLDSYRRHYFVNTGAFATTYRRTVLNFARLGTTDPAATALLTPAEADRGRARVEESLQKVKPKRVQKHGQLKYRRHALRLMLNFSTGLAHGRFNPRLTEREKAFVFAYADKPEEVFAATVVATLAP